ncbi:type VI secretion lipoprotein TssJ [Enterobacter cloacae subsp. cloacae]|nr:type VI secretion lipoprotein TssJ [Enterobacter cloacae subsp. cloacae]
MSSDFYSLQNNAVSHAWRESAEQRCFLPDAGPAFLRKPLADKAHEARYIGVMAEYQMLDGKKWRVSLPLPVPGKPSLPVLKWSSDELQPMSFST